MLLPYRVKVSDTKVTHFTTILALCTRLYRSHLRKPVLMKQTKHSRKSEAQNLCSKCPSLMRTHEFKRLRHCAISDGFASHIPAVRSGYRCLHGTAPAYLAESLHRTSDVDTRRRLRSADSAMLVVLCTRHSTLGDRAFPPSGFGTCMEQPAVVCQECTVADDVPSRAEDCTFPVVV